MKRRRGTAAFLLTVAVFLALALPARASTASVVIDTDRVAVTTHIGDQFTFRSTIRNTTERPLRNLVAHLNVLSLDPSVYVDPEDWSSARTQYLPPIAAGGSITVSWSVKAVNKGLFVLYVAVASASDRAEVDASAALRAMVTAPQQLSATGVLPIALAVPALTSVLLFASLRRRRQQT